MTQERVMGSLRNSMGASIPLGGSRSQSHRRVMPLTGKCNQRAAAMKLKFRPGFITELPQVSLL
jgi:hypothetical protein